MNANEITSMSLVDVAECIRRGDIRSTEVLEASIARLDKYGAELNVAIWVDAEVAYAAAEDADRKVARKEPLGLLHGVPLAHKDMFWQEGKKCTFGSKIFEDFFPTETSTVMNRMSQAGSIAFAGLNLAEFAQNGTGHNAHYGDICNAWNTKFISGGSSAGSGAAVSAEITFASLGSDTGGSVRLPASANGVTGLKPTHSRVSRHGVMPLSYSLDSIGPLARSARDCARILNVIAGHDAKDSSSSRHHTADYEAGLDGNVTGMRIGIPRNFFYEDTSESISKSCLSGAHLLRERGMEVMSVTLPHMDAISTYGSIVIRSEAASYHLENMRQRPGDIAVHVNSKLYSSLAIPATYYLEALRRRGALLKAFSQKVFTEVDVLIVPTIFFELPTRDFTDIDNGLRGAEFFPQRVSNSTRPFNYLGLPSVSVPCGLDANGLPIGMQIVGKPFDEETVLKVADAFQRETDWHKRRPTLSH
jgi:aspartyl-tRNA(Asn)/glutamyl-tRNA(Gln) amidotransferase subunit A